MPNKDKTGPNGEGPRTGRGLGNCNVNSENIDFQKCPKNGRRRPRCNYKLRSN